MVLKFPPQGLVPSTVPAVDLPTDVAYTDVNNAWTTVQNLPDTSTVGTNIVLSASGLAAARTFTFPDATDILVGRTATQTLTNKTLTSPVIAVIASNTVQHGSSNGAIISNSGLTGNRTFTFPDSTDTVVTLAATQTLTAKTLSAPTLSGSVAGTPTIASAWTWSTAQNLPNTSGILNPAGTFAYQFTASAILANRTITLPLLAGNDTLPLLGFAQTWTANQTFNDTNFLLRNPANTFSATISAGAQTANQTFTFPVTASDTITTIAATQTLTNKTLTSPVIAIIASNTVQHGSSNGVIISNSGLGANRTFTFPDLTDTVVTLTATQTLTGKTLTGNTAVNLVSGSGTLTLNTTGTVTLPNATDTLVGKATTDTLTNKTFDGESNTPKNMFPFPSVERVGLWEGINANGTGAGTGLFATGINVGGTVTGINPTATEGPTTKFDTGATSGTGAGIRESTNFFTTAGINGKIKYKLQLQQNNACGFWIGFISSGTFWTTADEPLANLSGVMFGFRSTDTNWTVARNAGSATSTFDTTPFGAYDTNVHTVEITLNGATNATVKLDSTTATYTTTIPVTSTTLTTQGQIINTAAASKTFELWYIQYRGDK